MLSNHVIDERLKNSVKKRFLDEWHALQSEANSEMQQRESPETNIYKGNMPSHKNKQKIINFIEKFSLIPDPYRIWELLTGQLYPFTPFYITKELPNREKDNEQKFIESWGGLVDTIRNKGGHYASYKQRIGKLIQKFSMGNKPETIWEYLSVGIVPCWTTFSEIDTKARWLEKQKSGVSLQKFTKVKNFGREKFWFDTGECKTIDEFEIGDYLLWIPPRLLIEKDVHFYLYFTKFADIDICSEVLDKKEIFYRIKETAFETPRFSSADFTESFTLPATILQSRTELERYLADKLPKKDLTLLSECTCHQEGKCLSGDQESDSQTAVENILSALNKLIKTKGFYKKKRFRHIKGAKEIGEKLKNSDLTENERSFLHRKLLELAYLKVIKKIYTYALDSICPFQGECLRFSLCPGNNCLNTDGQKCPYQYICYEKQGCPGNNECRERKIIPYPPSTGQIQITLDFESEYHKGKPFPGVTVVTPEKTHSPEIPTITPIIENEYNEVFRRAKKTDGTFVTGPDWTEAKKTQYGKRQKTWLFPSEVKLDPENTLLRAYISSDFTRTPGNIFSLPPVVSRKSAMRMLATKVKFYEIHPTLKKTDLHPGFSGGKSIEKTETNFLVPFTRDCAVAATLEYYPLIEVTQVIHSGREKRIYNNTAFEMNAIEQHCPEQVTMKAIKEKINEINGMLGARIRKIREELNFNELCPNLQDIINNNDDSNYLTKNLGAEKLEIMDLKKTVTCNRKNCKHLGLDDKFIKENNSIYILESRFYYLQSFCEQVQEEINKARKKGAFNYILLVTKPKTSSCDGCPHMCYLSEKLFCEKCSDTNSSFRKLWQMYRNNKHKRGAAPSKP